MSLPVSTPPNAIAYSRGEIRTDDMIVTGGIVGILATALIVAFAGPVINFWIARFKASERLECLAGICYRDRAVVLNPQPFSVAA